MAVNVFWPVSWLVWGLLVCVASQRQVVFRPKPKAEQLHITSRLCGTTQNVGEDTKRLFFPPDQTCRQNFNCIVTFRFTQKDTIPLATNLCVDFSRMRIYGTDTVLLIKDGSYGNHTQILTDDRYPLIEMYMTTVFCISKYNKLVLTFRTGCGGFLDHSFVSWMYVYLETTSSGSIYFVDGMGNHRHRMGVTGQPRVSVRSYVWTDLINHSQLSLLRLSLVGQSGRTYKMCITWNPYITPKVPLGVHFRQMKVFFNMEKLLSLYVTKEGGDTMSLGRDSPVCYNMKDIHEMLFKVGRDATVPVDPDWDDRELLFDLVVEVDNYNDVNDSRSGDTYRSTTGYMEEEEESLLSFLWSEYIWKVGLGVACLIIFSYCCYCCCRQECKEDSDNAGAQNAMETDNMEGGQDSYAMLPRTTPTAPQWADGDEGIRANESRRYVDPPGTTAHENPRNVPPPSYKDLFPDDDGGVGYSGK